MNKQNTSGLKKVGDRYYYNGKLAGKPAPKMTSALANALTTKANASYAKYVSSKYEK